MSTFASRREVLAAGMSAAALAALGRPALGAPGAPEQPSIKVGTAVSAMSFLPVYVALARRRDVPLGTLDEKLVAAFAGTGDASRVGLLGDWLQAP